jgi:hypothetical protein
MPEELKLYNYNNPQLDGNINAKIFSILSNNFPLSFSSNNNNWDCISHYIYGNLLNSIPSFNENINFKNYKLDFPYDENFHHKKNLSLYTVDISNYINDFINNNPTLKNNLKPDMSFSTNTNNIILNILSSDDFNLGKFYNRYISLENTKDKVTSIQSKDKQNISHKTKLLLKIYTVIQGLKLLMYKTENFNNLEQYENYSFSQITDFIINKFGKINLSYPVNIYNIYKLYSNKSIEFFSIYEKIFNNLELINHIVKLFIINNYQKYNNVIQKWCETQAYNQLIHTHLKEFIKLGEDPDDFETESMPYNITDNENKLLLSLSIDNLNDFRKELLNSINISCNVKFINQDKINNLYDIIKNIKNTNDEITNSKIFDNNEINTTDQNNEDVNEINLDLNFEEQMIHSLNLSNKTLIDDKHYLSPLKNYSTTIDNFHFNNILEFIYFNEYINLLNVTKKNNKNTAYELLFIDNTSENKSIQQLQLTYNDIFNKICSQLFHNCISEKLLNTQFNIALFLSKKFILNHEHPSENFIENNLFGNLLTNLSKENIQHPPDNYTQLINMVISNNKHIYHWIDDYIHYLCNFYISLCFHFKQFISKDDLQVFINEIFNNKFNFNQYKTYIPSIIDSFKYKVFCICNDLINKYNILFNIKLDDNFNVDISSIIWNTIFKLIEYLYSFKQTQLSMKLQYLLLNTQNIELSFNNVKNIFDKIINLIKIDNYNVNNSIILSLIVGIPVYSKDPIGYIQTNIESSKLPMSNDFYSNIKNKIYTFSD